MNKIIRAFPLLLLLPLFSLDAQEIGFVNRSTIPLRNRCENTKVEETFCLTDNDLTTIVEFRVGAFIPNSHLFRKIYGTAGPIYQLQASTKIYSHLDFWGNVDGFFKGGHPVNCSGSTSIKMPSGSFGINAFYPFADHFRIYIGLGPSFSGVWIKNKSVCNRGSDGRFAFGGIAKSGITYSNNGFFLEVFFDYLYQRIHYQKKVNMGGIKTGVGIGYQF